MTGGTMRNKRRKRSEAAVKLNITSMVDMFTLMVVFLLKNYSAEGQLVTPAKNLTLPTSSVERMAREALSIKVSNTSIMVENDVVIDLKSYQQVLVQKDFLITPLFDVLKKHSDAARKEAEMFKTEFSGKISIQGDTTIPYSVLTRVMYTCGQAGYPVMNLVVYRKG